MTEDQPPVGAVWDGTQWVAPTPPPAPRPPSSGSNVALWLIVGLLAVIAAPFALAMLVASGADKEAAQSLEQANDALAFVSTWPGTLALYFIAGLVLLTWRESAGWRGAGWTLAALGVGTWLMSIDDKAGRGSLLALGSVAVVAGVTMIVVGTLRGSANSSQPLP